jgi:hypothetical protein
MIFVIHHLPMHLQRCNSTAMDCYIIMATKSKFDKINGVECLIFWI